MKIEKTCEQNQWIADDFRDYVETEVDEYAESIRRADGNAPIDRDVIRYMVIGARLEYALPAGNA